MSKARKKRLLIGVLALIVALLICAIILKEYKSRKNTNEVVLSTAGGVLYEWKCDMDNEKIAVIEYSYYEIVDESEGGEVLDHFIIKGKKPGSTKLTCNYASGENIIETNIYKIYVDNVLNVSIQNSN